MSLSSVKRIASKLKKSRGTQGSPFSRRSLHVPSHDGFDQWQKKVEEKTKVEEEQQVERLEKDRFLHVRLAMLRIKSGP